MININIIHYFCSLQFYCKQLQHRKMLIQLMLKQTCFIFSYIYINIVLKQSKSNLMQHAHISDQTARLIDRMLEHLNNWQLQPFFHVDFVGKVTQSACSDHFDAALMSFFSERWLSEFGADGGFWKNVQLVIAFTDSATATVKVCVCVCVCAFFS